MVTSAARTQPVDPLGRVTRRTLTHPGGWAMTGRDDRLPYHRPGTVPSSRPPGAANRGIVPLVVAIRLHPAGAVTRPGADAARARAAAAGGAGTSRLHPAASAATDAVAATVAAAVRMPSAMRGRRGRGDGA